MRWEVTRQFENHFEMIKSKIDTVALVGGSDRDSEIVPLLKQGLDITFLGIESVKNYKFQYLDLNLAQGVSDTYDLVICSQVLEHVWDVKIALANLVSLAKPGGYVWINCPYSNHAHGSPEFYSAGYTPELITKLLSSFNIEIVYSTQLGSQRQYFFTHSIQYWPAYGEHKNPLKVQLSRYILRDLFWRFLAWKKDESITNNMRSATETIVLIRKNEN